MVLGVRLDVFVVLVFVGFFPIPVVILVYFRGLDNYVGLSLCSSS